MHPTSSEERFIEIYERMKERKPSAEQMLALKENIKMAKAFQSSGLWDELKAKYGEDKKVRIWDFLVAMYEGETLRAKALLDSLEDDLP